MSKPKGINREKEKARKTLRVADPDVWIAVPDNTVEARLIKCCGAKFCITIWGKDDIGVEWEGLDPDVARKIWKSLPETLTMKKALAMGFQRG